MTVNRFGLIFGAIGVLFGVAALRFDAGPAAGVVSIACGLLGVMFVRAGKGKKAK